MSTSSLRARSMALAALLGAALLVPAGALALDVSGVRFDDHVTLEGTSLVLNGTGLRHVTIFGIEVYVAGLYVPTRGHDATEVLRADRAKQVVLVMKRDVSRDQIGTAFREAIERSAGSRTASLRTEIDAFAAWIPAMHEHDRVTASYTPASGLTVTSTASTTTFHASNDFAAALFGVWIGPHAIEDSLRDGMLAR
jgi:long-chain acyl-CoA synthetase